MRVLIDTSVWVDFFNGHDSAEANTLARYLEAEASIATCGVVIAELFQGLRKRRSIDELRERFLDMDLLTPGEPETYFRAADLFRRLRRRGVTVRSTIDCLIVTLAAEHDAAVLAKDRDVRLILESKLSGAIAAPLLS